MRVCKLCGFTLPDGNATGKSTHLRNYHNLKDPYNDDEYFSTEGILKTKKEELLYDVANSHIFFHVELKQLREEIGIINMAAVSRDKKVEDLEEYRKNNGNTINLLKNKVADLEDWKAPTFDKVKELTDKVKALEECQPKLTLHRHGQRLADLEEWRQSHVVIPTNREVKVIDKKVWEDIKHHVGLLPDHWERCSKVKQAVKKADPSFCPND